MLADEQVRIARKAGEVLLSHFGTLSAADATRKGDQRRDLVSVADLAAEAAILESIPSNDRVLSEESGERAGDGRYWVVDPLDGTINFLHGIPFWCVSIATIEDGQLSAAVVHAPALGLTFSAERGKGAALNGLPINVSDVAEIGDSILATGFPYARDTVADNNLDNVPRLGLVAGGLRRMGSAALDLAFTAAGRLDGYWELQLNAWDVAAGVLLVREAGGRVTDFHGSEILDRILYGRHIVATNVHVHAAILERLAPLRELS
jgi:myo-inositol-1(or 4)-monophosphatase